jgi:DNA-binding CsgD family transcriptional regulator
MNIENLFGREEEIKQLDRIISNAKSGESGFCLLAGEAGVGKTSLLEEYLISNKIKFYTGRASADAATPYGLIASVLRAYLREQNKDEINFGPLTKYLGIFLPEINSEEKQIDQGIISEALCDAFEIISNKKLTVIFLDDIQWADSASLEIFPALSDKLKNSSMLFLATCRSDEIQRGHPLKRMRSELKRRRCLSEINLSALDINNTKKIISKIFEISPSDDLLKKIYNTTLGLPLFVEELSESLIAQNLIYEENGEVNLKSSGSIPLPDSIVNTVQLKITVLTGEASSMLDTAAVIGESFEIELLKKYFDSLDPLDELFAHGLIVELEPGKAAFKHSLTREAVKSLIPWSKRQNLYKKTAEIFSAQNYPPEAVAAYWHEANELINARNSYLKAASASCDIHAYGDAARSLKKALNIWKAGSDEEERMEALLNLAKCSQLNGKLNDAANALNEVIRSGGRTNDDKNSANAYSSLASIYGLQSKWGLVAKSRISAARHFTNAGMLNEAAEEYLAAAARYTGMLMLDDALNYSQLAIDVSEKINNKNVLSRAMGIHGNVLSMKGKFTEGQEIVEKGLYIAIENNLTEAASDIYRRLASTLEYASEYSSAKEVYYNAYNYCITTGSEVSAQICLSCMSYLFFQTGEWKKSIEVCNEVINNNSSPAGSKTTAYGMSGIIYAFRGEIKKAEKYLNKSINMGRRISYISIQHLLNWGKAVLAEQEGNNEKALSEYRTVIIEWKDSEDIHDVIPIFMWAANYFAKFNDRIHLTKCIEGLSIIAKKSSNPEALSGLSFALAELSALNKKYDEAAEYLEHALAHHEKLTVPLEKIFIEMRLGEILLQLSHKEEAAQKLKSAYLSAKNIGLRPFASRISGLLENNGYKAEERSDPDQPAMLERLTNRQNDILRLLGRGLTNKEIAEQLFISPRTVDMHMSHIFERLNCRTRTEAISKAKVLKII